MVFHDLEFYQKYVITLWNKKSDQIIDRFLKMYFKVARYGFFNETNSGKNNASSNSITNTYHASNCATSDLNN